MLNEIQKEALAEIERQISIIKAADIPQQEVIYVQGNLQNAINGAPEGVILDLGGMIFTERIVVDKARLTFRNGVIAAPPNTNDIVTLLGEDLNFHNLNIIGDGTTKRGVSAQGRRMLFDSVNILNIRRLNTETQALAIWDGTDLVFRNGTLEGASQSFISGGAGSNNNVPRNLYFENVLMTRRPEWRALSYAMKTIFELKNAEHVTVRNCTLENCWSQGQTGIAITLTPEDQTGNSPLSTVQDVLFDGNIIRNSGSGVSAISISQFQSTKPCVPGRNYRFINNDWTLSRALYGGHGSLLQIGKEMNELTFHNNRVTVDGDAMIRITDSRPINAFSFMNNNVRVTGQYGIFAPYGSQGIGFASHSTNSELRLNTLSGASSIFRNNFPDNTYEP